MSSQCRDNCFAMQGKVFRNAGITVLQCRVKCFAMQDEVFLSE